jgi:hypothetical protein
MSKLVIELDAEQERRLQEIASIENRSEQDLCEEAIESYLRSHAVKTGHPPAGDNPLLKLIGMVKEGPTDSSIYHDAI